jgi:hypothetical protein
MNYELLYNDGLRIIVMPKWKKDCNPEEIKFVFKGEKIEVVKANQDKKMRCIQ